MIKPILFIVLLFFFFSGFELPNSEPKEMKGMVERHNYWRARVGVGPVSWSNDAAKYAQAWADELAKRNCNMEHRPKSGKWKQIYGENIYWSSGMQNEAGHVVDSWASELEYYDEKKLECKEEWYKCGHYTQLVWANSTEIGCGMALCGNEEIWVCNYNPPGNWVGQKPYTKK